MPRYRTPLRYPGGKQKLSKFIEEILTANDGIGWEYVEPYAGGAGVAMELLLSKKVSKIHLNDSYFPVYAFWKSVIDFPDKFCKSIESASLTINEWKRNRDIIRNQANHSLFDIGFAFFYLNRCNRSGVISGGVIGGLDQSGRWKMDARFPRTELIQRIEAISSFKDSILVHNLDAEIFMKTIVNNLPQNTLVYCDPPYFEKASHLYMNSYKPDDHRRVASIIQDDLKHNWVVSYDGVYEILICYPKRRAFLYQLQYNAAKAYMGNEVFIFSDSLKIPKNSELPTIHESLPCVKKCSKLKHELANM